MSAVTLLHVTMGFVALGAGLPIFFATKGTPYHKRWGKVYAAAMYLLCGTSFWIQGTTPFTTGFDVFHVMTVVAVATLTAGLLPLMLRNRWGGWLELHYFFMLYSYVGLVMALGSHFFDYLGGWSFWARAALLWGLPYAVGTALIYACKSRFARLFVEAGPTASRAAGPAASKTAGPVDTS